MQQPKLNPLITTGFVLVIFLPVWVTAFLMFWTTGRTVTLTCDRLEWYYTQCQWQQFNSYGFRPEPKVPFRLRSASVEEYPERDSEGKTYTGYKLNLIANTDQQIELYRYKGDYNQAYADLRRILDFLGNPKRSTFQIEKQNFVEDSITLIWTVFFAIGFGVPCWLFLLSLLQSRFKKSSN